MAFQIRKSLEGTQHIIDRSMKHYDETKDLNALKVAFDGYVTLQEMLKQVDNSKSSIFDFLLSPFLVFRHIHLLLCLLYSGDNHLLPI